MQQQMLTQLAGENDTIQVDADNAVGPSVSVDINIRDDEYNMFESEANELFIRTPDMAEGMFVEVIPTSEGPTTQLRADVEQEELSQCEPAERAQETVEDEAETEVIVVD